MASGSFPVLSVIRINEYNANFASNRKLIIISAFDHLYTAPMILGNPVNINGGAVTDTPMTTTTTTNVSI